MIINLEQGPVQGGEDHSLITGKKFNTFYGIPYALAPVGELRFKPPVPAEKWTGTLDATQPRDWCVQSDFVTGERVGSEDCLFVNVFTPQDDIIVPDVEPEPPTISNVKKQRFGGFFSEAAESQQQPAIRVTNNETIVETPPEPIKPVMVHFRGGGYSHVNENTVGSFDNLVDYDVIMVTVSYRLHIFGFLNLNTPSCAGNCGCKDAVLALKWIKNNISAFGGDPNNVTLYGESAGAAMINLLSLSPMAEGLFKKVIMSAGHAFTPWAFNDDQVDVGFRVGRSLGFIGTDAEELAKFLRQQPAMALKDAVEGQHSLLTKKYPFAMNILFTPSREKFPEGAFLCNDPINLLKTARAVPTIAGVAEKEGVLMTLLLESAEQLMRLKDDPTDAIKSVKIPCQPSEVPKVALEVKIFYLQKPKTDKDIESRLIDFFSDLIHKKFYKSCEHVVKSGEPLYVYEFAYVGGLNESKIWASGLFGRYAGHADESSYVSLSRGFFPDPQISDADKEMIRKMCTLYTNFARTGNPNPDPTDEVEWKPYTAQNPCYLKINSKSSLINGDMHERGRDFWKYIWRNYVRL